MSSMSAWEVLGLDETVDARAIRRAYAGRVKQTRPDVDPAGFQLLTDAFDWALHEARRRQAELEQPVQADGADLAPPPQQMDPAAELGRPVGSGEPTAPEEAPPQEKSFAFGPFFEQLAEHIRKPNPLHLREWLKAHPDLYSIELKWALTPHVFDALAHNAAALEPHRGHLETLMGFFGVDARLRRHPALAPALDYLEAAPWRQQAQAPAPAAPMPAGWEDLRQVVEERDRRNGSRRQTEQSSAMPVVWIILALFAAVRLFMSL